MPKKQTENYELKEYIKYRTKKLGIKYEYDYPTVLE